MDSIWLVLGLALLPALGNFCGGLAAEASRTTDRRLNYALHGAAGLVIAVVAVEIMPRVLESLSAWLIALAFALGGIRLCRHRETRREYPETTRPAGREQSVERLDDLYRRVHRPVQ